MKYRLGDLTVKHWNSWDHVPRDPVSVGTAILSGFGVSTAVASTSIFFGLTTVAGFVGYLAISAVTSWALGALGPKPDFGAAGSSGILVNGRDAAAPHDFVYGETRKGGTVTFYETTGSENKYLHQVIALAGHELNSIGDIYINDEVVTLDGNGFVTSNGWDSKIRINKHRGNQTTADSDLVSETSVDSNFVGNGIAYLYVRYEYDQDVFANGVPLVTAKVQGKKVYDPRTSTTAYSNNAALCIRDFITSSYGLSDDSIDETVFSAAANECDESVTLSGSGSESRYTINGIIQASRAVGDVLQDLTTACAGTLFWGAGSWKLKVGAYSSPVKTLTLDDLRGPIALDTRITMRDNFNTVSGTFIDADQDYITADYPQLTSATFKAEDGDQEAILDLPLPYTTSAATAQRIAKLTLFRGREQMTLSADFGLEAFEVEVGDIIAFTNDRYGFSAKEFEVIGWRLSADQDAGDLRVNLTLRETSSAAFDWNAEETAIIANNTTLPDPFAGIDVTGLSVSDGGGEVQGDGSVVNSLVASWTASTSAFVSHYEIQWGQTSSANRTTFTTSETSVVLAPVVDDVEYTVRVRTVSVNGIRGDFESATATAGGDTTAPSTPTGLDANGILGGVEVTWTNPADADFKHVEVYESADTTFGNAVEIGRTAGSRFVRANLAPNVTRYYWVRAVDFSDNASSFIGSQSATTKLITADDLGNAIVPYEALDTDLQATIDAKAETTDLSNYVTTTDYNLSVDGIQELEDKANDLATKALEFFTQTSALESRISDAGIVVNPADGSVSIQTVSALDTRVNTVEVDLDAVESELTLKASTTYVNNAIAAAVLDSADLASLNDLEGRVDDVEIVLDGGGDILAASAMVEGTAYTIYTVGTTNFTNFGAPSNTVGVTFYATGAGTGTGQVQEAGATARIGLVASGLVYDITDGELSVSELSGSITTLQGEVSLKASSSDLTTLTGRVTTAEQDIAAIDAASITQNLIDLQGVSEKIDDLSELSLKEVLGRYADRKYLTSDIAIARTQLTADVTDQRTALAEQKLELGANIDANTASIVETNTALANETSARVALETSLQAQIDSTDATLIEVINLDATAGHASVDQFLQLKAEVEDTDTGLTAAHGEINQLNNVDVGSTSALVQAHLELNGTVNDPTTGLAAAQASIDQINTITADTTSAAAEAIFELEASVNDPTTGLAAATAAITEINDVSVDTTSAAASAIFSLQGTVNDTDTGVAAINASITQINTITADSTSNVASAVHSIQTALELEDGTYGKITELNDISSDVDGISARYGVEIDTNGIITGYQLLSGAGDPSAFNVRADQFNVYSTDGTTSDVPFSVFTSARTVDGVSYPAGIYMDDVYVTNSISLTDESGNVILSSGTQLGSTYIADAAITSAKIDDAAITTAKIDDLSVSTLKLQNEAVTIHEFLEGTGESISSGSTKTFSFNVSMPSAGTISAVFRNFVAGSIGGGDSISIATRLRNAQGTETTTTTTASYPIAVGSHLQIMSKSTNAGTCRIQVSYTPSGFIATASTRPRIMVFKRFK